MIRSERNSYVGIHVTAAVKTALETIAGNRQVSVSALAAQILSSDPGIKVFVDCIKPPKLRLVRRKAAR